MRRRVVAALSLALPFAVPAASAAAGSSAPPAQERWATLDGIRVRYLSAGEGPVAVVFVHGWTCDLTSWSEQLPAFAGKVRTIAVDLPGHGRSDKPEIAYSMDLFARAVDAVLRDAGVERAVLVGHSMGTPVVRQLARLFPRKAMAIVAVDGALRGYAMSTEQKKAFLGSYEGPDFREKQRKAVESMFTAATTPAVREKVAAVMLAAPQNVLVSAMRGMLDESIWGDDPIPCPVLAIHARSPHWGPDYQAYVKKLRPDVQFRMLDGVGHFLMLEKPRTFNRIVLAFLDKLGLVNG
jgi:pimeloyl-ACP methyl ester carboxylesterase